MEKIFANEATDKTPNKQTAHAVQYIKKKFNQKMGGRLIDISQRRHTMAKHMKRCSTLLLDKFRSKL